MYQQLHSRLESEKTLQQALGQTVPYLRASSRSDLGRSFRYYIRASSFKMASAATSASSLSRHLFFITRAPRVECQLLRLRRTSLPPLETHFACEAPPVRPHTDAKPTLSSFRADPHSRASLNHHLSIKYASFGCTTRSS